MIFQGDVTIQTAIELGFEDMRKNPWLVDDMLSDFTNSMYLKEKYGKKQVDACKEWLANNQVDVYVRPRDDKDRLPCITVEMGHSNEKQDMRHMGDLTPFKKMLFPNEIGKPIPYVVNPFVPIGYDENTGTIEVDTNVDLSLIAPGMILVNPANGLGYIIQEIVLGGFTIEPNLPIDSSEFGIVPQYQFYTARIEHSFFEESYNISVHAHGDIQTTLWLWSIVKYSLLRYRQSLFEANGFAESHISSGNPDLNYDWTTDGGEKVYTRAITLTGQVQNTWIKAPHRIIETVNLKNVTEKDCVTSFSGGIKILSNLDTPDFIDKSQQLWTTIQDSPEDEDE
ncbi:MAG TPA: hypothetical protein VN855_00620 [Candidatus Acidoferrum sp.]|nr:hypothetical protein [Candidatus Acidoferrum sp.]